MDASVLLATGAHTHFSWALAANISTIFTYSLIKGVRIIIFLYVYLLLINT